MSYRKLGRTSSQRKAMLRDLTTDLLINERIVTTEARAKEVRSTAEKMITLGKRGDLHARRQAMATLRDEAAVKKLFDVLGPRYKERNGGYTRVLKAGFRFGDAAPMAFIELVERDVEAKGAADKARVEAEREAEDAAEDLAV
jgi:large subunit ribosomal protein L17